VLSNFPKTIVIDNCGFCNLNCVMCDHKNILRYRDKRSMDISLYRKIIKEISVENKNARVWEIFFGEPCLCKDMSSRIKEAKEAGLNDVVLNSNGVLLTDGKSRSYIESGLDCMYVGLDAITESTYDLMRVGGDFKKVVKNILLYRDNLQKFGTTKQKLFVQFIEGKYNAHEKSEFVERWYNQGVEVKVRSMLGWAGLLGSSPIADFSNRKPCYWIQDTMVVCSNGCVPLCACDVHCRVECGNLNNSTMKEVWGGKLKTYREYHINNEWDKIPDICKSCTDWVFGRAEYA